MLGPRISLAVLLAAVVILALLAVILGYRNRATRRLYWAIAAIEVVVFAVSWLFLALMTDLVVVTHVSLPLEQKFIVIDILNTLSFLGLCVLLAYIETHRGSPKPSPPG
ncbi:MAG: hypothetical protein C4K48_03430 [Candidatus Thorarchaeota archaeon]|nr:MAG: hypothetical protein C4K48_03430 [Candidatus Thorarchaeota archaeon]